EHLRQLRAVRELAVECYGKLTAVRPRNPAVVGIRIAGNRKRIQTAPAEVIESHNDMRARGIDGDRRFGLRISWADVLVLSGITSIVVTLDATAASLHFQKLAGTGSHESEVSHRRHSIVFYFLLDRRLLRFNAGEEHECR